MSSVDSNLAEKSCSRHEKKQLLCVKLQIVRINKTLTTFRVSGLRSDVSFHSSGSLIVPDLEQGHEHHR